MDSHLGKAMVTQTKQVDLNKLSKLTKMDGHANDRTEECRGSVEFTPEKHE